MSSPFFGTGTPQGTSPIAPPDQGDLIVVPLLRESLALNVATLIRTDRSTVRVPILDEDVPSGWTPEGSEIVHGEPDMRQAVLTPHKVAAVTTLSNELVSDSTPEAAAMVGQSIARSMRRVLDGSFLVDAGTEDEAGQPLASVGVLATPGVVDGGTFTAGTDANLDVLSDAINAVLRADGIADTIVMSPQTWGVISQLKATSDSAVPLLGSPAGMAVQPGTASAPGQASAVSGANAGQPQTGGPQRPSLFNAPVFVDSTVPDSMIGVWDSRAVAVALRNDVSLQSDSSARFSADSTMIRGTIRCDYAVVAKSRVVKIAVE